MKQIEDDMMTMKKTASALMLALTLGAAAFGSVAHAADAASLTDAKKAEIEALIVAQGYEVRSVQIEDGMYEVYAVKDGQMAEIYLDDNLNVVSGMDADEG